ncbi:MAG TPA: CPBP family glutamic-type intramembrane protease [Thermoanaerobaculia bacterium]|nr:CPBP family glutamic-type intramembrane protease [Thermoanaerobaculia bacterium]
MERLGRRDLRFLGVCLAIIACGAVLTSALFRKAFPEAAIEFHVNRSQARVVAEKFLSEQGLSVAGARFAGEFDVDDTVKVYLERDLGLERASELYGRAAKIWLWRMRWFRSGVKEEQRVDLSPLGDLIGFQSVLREDAPGARLSRDEARTRALAFLASRGLAAADLTPVEATPVERPNRRDWRFVDEKKGVRFADATVRFATTVAGDRVTAYTEFVHVPEQWLRDYDRLRSKNEAAGEIATFGLFVTLLAMLAVLVRKIILKDVPWRLVATFGGIAFVLQLLSTFNELPLTLFAYDTASPLSAYLTNRVLLGILLAVATGAGIGLVVAAAEPIYRERFPVHLSLGGAFSARGIQSKAFLKSVVLGYALVAFFFAYQAVFYVVAARFGAWAPADVPYSDMLNTAFPWATVLLIGFLPAVTEEGISRMFSISFLDKLGVGRVAAVVIPAFIWGFGHSTYPNQPFFIRGIEVGCAGVVIGFVMLRWGIVPLLVWHFTVDALYTALVLLRSGNAYYVVSGAAASGILLLPLIVSLVLYARRGGFASAAGLTNADVGFVPEPRALAPPPADLVPSVRPLPRAARLWGTVAAVLLCAGFLVPVDVGGPVVDDATGRATANELARAFLHANGADPDTWSSVAYTGTGFSYDQSVREARPLENSGIPGFSEDAARYVVDHGGLPALKRLTERQAPLAYWVVRFFRPEQREEWKILVDARRARVVAFIHPIAEDAAAGPPLSSDDAKRRAFEAAGLFGYPASEYQVLEVGTEARPHRVDTTVVLESKPSGVGEARPRLTATFHGPSLAGFLPTIQIPESFVREARKRSSAEVILTGVKVVAAGGLVGLGVILFLRRVREPGFRWRSLVRPLLLAAAIAGLGIFNAWPSLFRAYPTERPMSLFRLGLVVSLVLALLGLLLIAALGFVLLGAARPGWAGSLRRGGGLADGLVRALLSAAIVFGFARWVHVVAARVPAFSLPDPSLPTSLADAVPPYDAVWAAARGAFGIAAIAAAAALAWNSNFFRSAAGRTLGFVALVVALVPSELRSPGEFGFSFVTALLAAGWIAVCAFGLLRDHAGAWVLFGLIRFGGGAAGELLAQSAPPNHAAGIWSLVLLAVAGVALLIGRRRRTPLVSAAPIAPPT